jgi:hypothetical protein
MSRKILSTKTQPVQLEDPILPFSVTINKEELPSGYSGIPFDPQISYGAQANGFYGNIRYKLFGTTRVFFFQIQPEMQNLSNYYTITVVVPGKKSKLSREDQEKLDILLRLCSVFKRKNDEFIEPYTREAANFVNLAVRHVGTSDWGTQISPDYPVEMVIVFNQLDLGQLTSFDPNEFPVATIDFNPSKGGRRKGNKRIRRTNKRIRRTNKRIPKNKKHNKGKTNKKRK